MALSDGARGGWKWLAAVGFCAACLISSNLLGPHLIAAEPDASTIVAAPEAKPETRTLRMKHRWTGETLDVVYKVGGEYQPAAMEAINRFMRDWRCNKAATMDPKLVDKLFTLQQVVGANRTMWLISGYRSEGYNASLLESGRTVDPHSEHMLGKAADVFVPGVPAEALKAAAEQLGPGGVGYYPFSGPRFVHVDTGPDRHWTEMDPAERRRQGIAKPPHKPLKLDCSLTMTEALKIIPMDKALAALPQGAAIGPAPDAETSGVKQPRPETSVPGASDRAGSNETAAPAEKAPPCEADGGAQKIDAFSGDSGGIIERGQETRRTVGAR